MQTSIGSRSFQSLTHAAASSKRSSRSKRSNRLRRSKAGIRHVARGNRQKLIVCDVPDCPHHVVERGVRRMDAVQESDLGSCVSIDLFFSTMIYPSNIWP